MTKLTNYTLADIHAIILKERTTDAASGALGVRTPTLNTYLGRLSFGDSSPVSVEGLLARTVEQAREEFSERYDTVIEVARIPPESRTLAYIHAIILQKKTVYAASRALGVEPATLNAYLGRLRFGDSSPVSVEGLLARTVEQARQEFSERYDTVIEVARIPLESRTLAYIHAIILQKKTVDAAAGALGVASQTLNTYLGKLSFGDSSPVSVKGLLSRTVEQAREEFSGRYDTVIEVARIPLKSRTLAYIHAIILQKKTVDAAAGALGVVPQTLNTYLGKLSFGDGSPVSVEGLLSRTVEQVREEFSERYDTVIEVARIPLESRTLAYIHAIILQKKTVYAAAGALGVASQTLNTYLGKLSFGDSSPVTFDGLLARTVEQAREEFSGRYDTVIKVASIPLESRTLAYIHAIILQKKTVYAAAGALGAAPKTLNDYLRKLQFGDRSPVSFDGLLARTVEQARKEFSERYDAVMELVGKRRREEPLSVDGWDVQDSPFPMFGSVMGGAAEQGESAGSSAAQPAPPLARKRIMAKPAARASNLDDGRRISPPLAPLFGDGILPSLLPLIGYGDESPRHTVDEVYGEDFGPSSLGFEQGSATGWRVSHEIDEIELFLNSPTATASSAGFFAQNPRASIAPSCSSSTYDDRTLDWLEKEL